jgi:enoyl-CoA hydratase
VNFGLMPGGGSTQRLPRRVGLQRAMELLTTGKWLSGTEAVEWGLALRSAPVEGLDDELESILGPLRTKSREGLALIKATTLRGMGMSMEDGVELESRTFAQYMTTSPHPAEGIKAFIEKRTPEF